MSIMSTASTFIQKSFNAASDTVDSLEKGIDIVNNYVENQHKRVTRTVEQDCILAVAEHHAKISEKLDADEKLAEIFAKLEEDW